jgi:hypothetical protein
MELILVIGVIYLVAVILAWFTKIDIAYLFAPAIFGIVIWEFAFGIFGYLNLGLPTLLIFITLVLALLLAKSSDFRKQLVNSLYLPSTIAFVSLSLISLYKCKDWLLSIWDEFSHWGLYVKAMYEYSALAPATPIDLWHPGYPPGLSLFQYFVLEFDTGWREGLLFWSIHLIVISVVVSVLAKSTYKYPYEFFLKLFIALAACSTFFNNFDNIYQDSVLALAFGFLLAMAIMSTYLDGKWVVVLALTAGFVALVKPVGIYFAAAAIFLNLVATVFSKKKNSRRSALAAFTPAMVSLATVVAVWTVWRRYVLSLGLSNSGISDAVPTGFNEAISQEVVINNFVNAFFHENLRPSFALAMPPTIWTILCGVFFLIWSLLSSHRNNKRDVAIGITLLLLTAGYFGVILFSYLTVFVASEAVGIASYSRYIGTWYQGVFFAIVVLILSELNLVRYFHPDDRPNIKTTDLNMRRQVSLFLVAFIGVTMLTSVHNYMMMLGVSKTQGSEVRKPFVPIVEAIKNANMPMQSKVYIVAQHTVGFEYFVLRYEMPGKKFGQVPWSMGSPFGDTDIWTDPTWDNKKWSNELLGFDYVVLYKTTEGFNTEFGSLFESGVIESDSVYRVVKSVDGVSLAKVS